MQIQIGEEVSGIVKDEISKEHTALQTFCDVMKQCLNRDEGWKQFYKEGMDKISLQEDKHPLLSIINKEFKAEQACIKSDYDAAAKI